MRFTLPSALPTLLLILLPFLKFNYVFNVFAIVSIFVVRQYYVLKPIFTPKSKHKKDEDLLVLESQPLSPYVEKVRWCLDYGGFNYIEEMDLGSIGVLLHGRKVPTLKVPSKNISLQNSSDILRYLYGISCGKDAEVARFLEPNEASLMVESMLDELAQDAKALFYPYVFKNPKVSRILPTLLGIQQSNVPLWQKILFGILEPVLKVSILMRNNIDPDTIVQCRKSVSEKFARIERSLADGRKFLLGGDEPSFVDFQFAAIGHFCMEKNDLYGGRAVHKVTRIPMRELFLPEDLEENSSLFEDHPKAIEFAERMYKEYRMQKNNRVNAESSKSK